MVVHESLDLHSSSDRHVTLADIEEMKESKEECYPLLMETTRVLLTVNRDYLRGII